MLPSTRENYLAFRWGIEAQVDRKHFHHANINFLGFFAMAICSECAVLYMFICYHKFFTFHYEAVESIVEKKLSVEHSMIPQHSGSIAHGCLQHAGAESMKSIACILYGLYTYGCAIPGSH